MSQRVTVIGAGLAGCEAAFQLARRGIAVDLIESKPLRMSPAHTNPDFCELVCSNSLKSQDPATAHGLLKTELQLLDSLVMRAALATRVPAGSSLSVDRQAFAAFVTAQIRSMPLVTIHTRVAEDFDPDTWTVVATGPLTDGPLAQSLTKRLGGMLHFFDAAAPIITGESVDMNCAFVAARYDKGDADYINCPLERQQYYALVQHLRTAQRDNRPQWDDPVFFEGCMPVEELARRGEDTLRYGAMRPVGLIDPHTQRRPFAVVQLRRESATDDLYNLVGFQTGLRHAQQKQMLQLVPALANAQIVRFGLMHRNSYVDAPTTLDPCLRMRTSPRTLIAGQLCGVEGYVESTASGMVAALTVAAMLRGQEPTPPPRQTMCGALLHFCTTPSTNFQPINANFGILPPLQTIVRSREQRHALMVERAQQLMAEYAKKYATLGAF